MIAPRNLRTFIASGLTVFSLLALTACTGSSSAPVPSVEAAVTTTSVPDGEKLTSQQATVLSRLLFLNYDKGGADLDIAVPYGIGSSITMKGQIDWKTHIGNAVITVVLDDGTVVDTQTLYWASPADPQRGVIVTTLKGLPEALEKNGRPGVKYVARPFAEKSPVDIIVRYIDALASVQADNPLLLRQDPKTGYLGTDTVSVGGVDIAADLIRYGKSRYWVDPKTKTMVQVAAPLGGLRDNTVYKLSNNGPKTIALPQNAEVVNSAEIPEIYEELTQRPKE